MVESMSPLVTSHHRDNRDIEMAAFRCWAIVIGLYRI